MITACYTTDLYCDCAECKSRTEKLVRRQYTGETWGQTIREARRDGWRIGRDKQTAYAPGHKSPKQKGEK